MEHWEKLNSLPEGALVEDSDQDWSFKRNGDWHGEYGTMSTTDYAEYGPFEVISLPVVAA